MADPKFITGQLTREVAEPIAKHRLVVEADGKLALAQSVFPYGVVSEPAEPQGEREKNNLAHGLPAYVRVSTTQCVAKIATDGEIAAGADVFAAADGKVSATGAVKVGIAHAATKAGVTEVNLFHPSIFGGASA